MHFGVQQVAEGGHDFLILFESQRAIECRCHRDDHFTWIQIVLGVLVGVDSITDSSQVVIHGWKHARVRTMRVWHHGGRI